MPKKKENKPEEISKEEDLKKGEVVEEEPVEFEEGEPAEPAKGVFDEHGVVDENKVIQTIILGSDWQEVLTTLVAEEGMDPLYVDLIKLADVFRQYLEHLKQFDFRIPARFILVAAILLRMKAELLLDEEEEKIIRTSQSEPLNIDVPLLLPPITRKPTRKVTLNTENDIEVRIKEIYEEIVSRKAMTFSQLVPAWKKMEIVKTFLPLLHLATRDMVTCEQEEMFKEIFIRIKMPEEKKPETPVQ
ncbi:MAG: segregation/condensation protein A [Candidatus Aenigmarchaeota archaeon]|nr:segregation/condensation protein A [Candidatus Aenigmarchaeota archaeon]